MFHDLSGLDQSNIQAIWTSILTIAILQKLPESFVFLESMWKHITWAISRLEHKSSHWALTTCLVSPCVDGDPSIGARSPMSPILPIQNRINPILLFCDLVFARSQESHVFVGSSFGSIRIPTSCCSTPLKCSGGSIPWNLAETLQCCWQNLDVCCLKHQICWQNHVEETPRNMVTPNHPFYRDFPLHNHPFLGTPNFRKPLCKAMQSHC